MQITDNAVTAHEDTQQLEIQPSLIESLEREEPLRRPDETLEILKRLERKIDDYRRGTEVLAAHSAKVTRDVETIAANVAVQQDQMHSILAGVESILGMIEKSVQGVVQTPTAPRGGITANATSKEKPWARAASAMPRLGDPFTIGHCPTHRQVNLNKFGRCVACCNEATKALYAQRQAVP